MTTGRGAPEDVLGNPKKIFPDVDEYGWRDITAPVTVRGVGANDPDWSQIGSGPFYAYKFAVNDQCWFAFHVPHDLVPGCQVFFHTHWLTDGTDTAVVKWEFTYSYAKGFNQSAYDSDGTAVTAEQAGSGTAYQHMVTETSGVTIAGLTEPDGIIYVRVRRVTNAASPAVENADGIFLLTADIHYQTTNTATYGKAPNFYTG